MRDSSDSLVLVTGASGFIAKHIVLELLQRGYRVRGTVRDRAKGEALAQTMALYGAPVDRLETVQADLAADAGWNEAVQGCRYVLHTASPFPENQPRDKFGLVPLARGGTERVCRAARDGGAERLVLTSSVASILYGHAPPLGRPFGEGDFSNVESPHISPYAVSKTLAEQAAWSMLEGSSTELATINPSLVFGPLLDATAGTSARLVAMMMNGKIPAMPNVRFGMVDVRDVAQAHIRAMEIEAAAGRRFIVSAGTEPLRAVADILSDAFPQYGRRLHMWNLPDWTVRLAARLSRQAGMLAAELGAERALDTAPAKDVLQMQFRTIEEAVTDLGESLIRFGLVRP